MRTERLHWFRNAFIGDQADKCYCFKDRFHCGISFRTRICKLRVAGRQRVIVANP
jgi:hypothetical protein